MKTANDDYRCTSFDFDFHPPLHSHHMLIPLGRYKLSFFKKGFSTTLSRGIASLRDESTNFLVPSRIIFIPQGILTKECTSYTLDLSGLQFTTLTGRVADRFPISDCLADSLQQFIQRYNNLTIEASESWFSTKSKPRNVNSLLMSKYAGSENVGDVLVCMQEKLKSNFSKNLWQNLLRVPSVIKRQTFS